MRGDSPTGKAEEASALTAKSRHLDWSDELKQEEATWARAAAKHPIH